MSENRTGTASLPTAGDLSVLLIGAGTMGGAVAAALLRAGVSPENLRVRNSRAESTRAAADRIGATAATGQLAEAARGADLVVLGVKPYQLDAVLPDLADALEPGAVVLSLAAGFPIARLEALLPAGAAVVRAMPNTPVGVGEGVVSLSPGTAATESQLDALQTLLATAGTVVVLPEADVHGVVGLSGSGVAVVFYLLEAMVDGAVAQGMPRSRATELAIATVRGAAAQLAETGMRPGEAREGVMSPGGTTARAMQSLDRDAVKFAIAQAMDAAADRSRALEAAAQRD